MIGRSTTLPLGNSTGSFINVSISASIAKNVTVKFHYDDHSIFRPVCY